ncbi:unnamed protein product [Caenorhabditis auriculariae]|uniref:Uncharacterized protein n=1 Tax=Caenorhabditis auriculariae TaxID=2777116 RepID=A0A8S1H2L4_9PELO|nr:unnamed protein product [Caenorhabditis auriculariae]
MDVDNNIAQCSSIQIEATQHEVPKKNCILTPALTVQTSMKPMSTDNRVEMWRNRNFDSGFHTMNPSEAPSMISSLHPSSHISGMSNVTEYEQSQLSDQQQMKFDGIPACPEQQYGSAVRAIPELTQLIKDNDHAVVYKAVYIMQNIAKMDSDTMRRQKPVIADVRVIHALSDVLRDKMQYPNIIRVALGTIFHICNRPDGIELVAHVAGTSPSLLTHIVQHMHTVNFSCYKYALLTFHSLLSDRQAGPGLIPIARRINALQPIVRWLGDEKSEKLLPVIVDLVRIICDKQNELRGLFIKADGARKLLDIIQSCTYENLLWRSTQLLKSFTNFDAETVVASGAREVLAPLLSHDSDRLVVSSLECLRNLSDVPSRMEDEVLLHSLLMLLGVRTPVVMLYTVQIISNMCANNKMNKEFLVRNQAVEHLLRVLIEETAYSSYNHLTNKEAQMLEELTESILCTFRHLCVGHNLGDMVQQLVMRQPHHTLNLLSKSANQDGNLPVFRDFRSGNLCFVEQIIHILRVACSQLATHDQIEGVRVSDLIYLSVNLLLLLSHDGKILDQVVYFLKHPENQRINEITALLPIYMLYHIAIADDLENDQALLTALHHISRTAGVETASFAERLYKEIKMNAQLPQSSNFSFATQPMSVPEIGNMRTMLDEPMDGAGEQWSQDLASTDDPFANVFCGKEPASVQRNSPEDATASNWTVNHAEPDSVMPGPCNSPSFPGNHLPMVGPTVIPHPRNPYFPHLHGPPPGYYPPMNHYELPFNGPHINQNFSPQYHSAHHSPYARF